MILDSVDVAASCVNAVGQVEPRSCGLPRTTSNVQIRAPSKPDRRRGEGGYHLCKTRRGVLSARWHRILRPSLQGHNGPGLERHWGVSECRHRSRMEIELRLFAGRFVASSYVLHLFLWPSPTSRLPFLLSDMILHRTDRLGT